MTAITLYGVPLSPYVRKVALMLAYKQVEYQLVPVVPIPGNDQPKEFVENSPLGKIPLLRAGDNYLSDSSVICAWIEREYPQKPLLPEDNFAAAQALWFEEYGDSQIVPVVGGHLFAEVVLAPHVFKRPPIQEDIDAALTTEIPAIFDYLSSQLSGDFLVGDTFTFADLSITSHLATLYHCDYRFDTEKWPRLTAYLERIMALPIFVHQLEVERNVMQSLVR